MAVCQPVLKSVTGSVMSLDMISTLVSCEPVDFILLTDIQRSLLELALS
jgi:hypothetical protein